MPTTTKMGIAYPASTDLVKDGATAMGTISTTVDAKTGLVLINTTAFTAVSAVSLAQDTFTANFDNYFWSLRFTTTSGGQIQWRGRVAGTDSSAANYVHQGVEVNAGAVAGFRGTGQTSGYLGYTDTNYNGLLLNIIDPKATQPTGVMSQNLRSYNATPLLMIVNNGFTATTSFDSASIFIGAGTMTGTYSIYGYNK
jgi:hypothetical protein